MTPVARFELILVLLGAALLLSPVAGRLGFPPAAALVLGGVALAVKNAVVLEMRAAVQD